MSLENLKLSELVKNQSSRIELGKQSMQMFGYIYFPHYFTFKSPPFHKDFTKRLQDDDITRVAECDFRESAKSVLVDLVYVLWNICYQKRRFVIIGSETSEQATMQLSAIIYELQANDMILRDFGVLYKETRKADEVTRKKSVKDFITENNIRVMSKGKGESIRGLRHLKWRPDLYIGDDLDSLKTVKEPEQREKTYRYLKAEVMSGMNQEYGKVVIIGNMIHFDCIMARLKKDKLWDYNEVPIYKDGKLAWPERHFWKEEEANEYNNKIKVKELKRTSIELIKRDKGTLVFAQEYLLQPMSDEDRIIKPEWIQYYDKLPDREWLLTKGFIDPAIKEKERSDYSAICIAAKDKRKKTIYIMDIWQGKISMDKQADKVIEKHNFWDTVEFGVEVNAYQEALKQTIDNKPAFVPTRGITQTKDKVTRLLAIQPYIERGDIVFDRKLSALVEQLIEFPLGEHDDMVDAMISVVERLIKGGVRFNSLKTEEQDKPLTANLMEKIF